MAFLNDPTVMHGLPSCPWPSVFFDFGASAKGALANPLKT